MRPFVLGNYHYPAGDKFCRYCQPWFRGAMRVGKQERAAAAISGGQTVLQACASQRISPSTFYRWSRRIKNEPSTIFLLNKGMDSTDNGKCSCPLESAPVCKS